MWKYLFITTSFMFISVLPTDTTWAQKGGAGKGNVDREQMRKKMLEKFDADGDGKLNEQERQTLRKAIQERRGGKGGKGMRGGRGGKGNVDREQMRKKALEKFDADGDGELNEQERQALRKAIQERRGGKGNANREQMRKKALEKFDADGDGELNEQERQALREAIQKRRGGKGVRQGLNEGGDRKRG